jgi:hypothetical protein
MQQPNIYGQLRSLESFADSPWQFEQVVYNMIIYCHSIYTLTVTSKLS